MPAIDGFTHLVLTGSEASILRWAPWMTREAELVRAAADNDVRMLGSCFGHQMLVAALCGREALQRAARPEVGWTALDVVGRDELTDGLPNPWTVFSFHFDEVAAPPPPPWRVLARSHDCGTQIIRWGSAAVWGIQGHPEISRRTAELATRAYLLVARRRGGVPRTTLQRSPADDQAFAGLVGRFLGGAACKS